MKALKFTKLAIDADATLPGKLTNKQIHSLSLIELYKHIATPYGISLIDLVEKIITQRCKKCGCTQNDCSQCIEKTGEACYWVSNDLCSACVTKKPAVSTKHRAKHKKDGRK